MQMKFPTRAMIQPLHATLLGATKIKIKRLEMNTTSATILEDNTKLFSFRVNAASQIIASNAIRAILAVTQSESRIILKIHTIVKVGVREIHTKMSIHKTQIMYAHLTNLLFLLPNILNVKKYYRKANTMGQTHHLLRSIEYITNWINDHITSWHHVMAWFTAPMHTKRAHMCLAKANKTKCSLLWTEA